MVHGEHFPQPASLIIKAILDATNGSWVVQCNPQKSWTPPPMGWLKINFDGSIFPNYVAGLGGIIRDHLGNFIAAKGIRSFSRSIPMTEFRSAAMALELSRQWFGSVLGLILEGDSSDVCSMLTRILDGLHVGDTKAAVAKALKDAPRIEISCIDRSANEAANYIARRACDQDFCWDRGMPLPQDLSLLMIKDFSFM